ncbi:hypothetical protein GCM10023192_52680 [Amycolatopsis samaneae]
MEVRATGEQLDAGFVRFVVQQGFERFQRVQRSALPDEGFGLSEGIKVGLAGGLG